MMLVNKDTNDYSDGVKKLITDIKKEMDEQIKDGIAMKLTGLRADKRGIYNFLKDEGYKMNYVEFSDFYEDGKKIVKENQIVLEKTFLEQSYTELSMDELEEVSGGRSGSRGDIDAIFGGAIVLGMIVLATSE